VTLYTARGSAELDVRIDADMACISKAVSPHALAGILIGGYGRGEGTPFITPDGSQVPFNDYDLVVVVGRLNGKIRQKFNALEKHLTDELGLPVDLCPYRKVALPRCEFSLLNYEMKHGHKVVWGDEDILAALPDYPRNAIPLSEGTRLLLNRGKLLLDIQQRLARPEPLSEEERVRFIKFIHKAYLAFGDCALLASGRYDISYAVKKERILNLPDCPDHNVVTDGYLKAIELKEWGDFQALKEFGVAVEFEAVRNVFLRFLPWYRTQYSGREGSPLNAIAHNLKWGQRFSTRHPRERLYDAVMDLLKDAPDPAVLRRALGCRDNFVDTFYTLQSRFS